jgi:Ca-activated chloride channel family protein
VVSDGEALRDVYAEIDALEKTEIESIEHTSYAERFAVWAAAGAGLLLLELVLGATVLRRSP